MGAAVALAPSTKLGTARGVDGEPGEGGPSLAAGLPELGVVGLPSPDGAADGLVALSGAESDSRADDFGFSELG